MDEAAARQHVRDGARVVYIDEPGCPSKLVKAEPPTDTPPTGTPAIPPSAH